MRNDWAILPAPVIIFLTLGLLFSASGQDQLSSLKTINANSRTDLPTLTDVDQIRRLTSLQAEQHYPVRLRGVVLDYLALPVLFVSDGTNSIYVRVSTNQTYFQGQLVEINGFSDSGKFAPVIVPSKIRVVGEGQLPSPSDTSFQKIASGVEDSQWVRIRGIVRSTGTRNLNGKLGKLICPELTLATEDGGRLPVLINNYHEETRAALWSTRKLR